MKNILIIGGAGFIGSNISLRLDDEGYNVTVLDIFSDQVHGADYTRSYLYNTIAGQVNIVRADALDANTLLKHLKRNELVIHMASETGTAQSMYRLRHYTEVNIGSIAVLMDLIVNHSTKVKKVFLASSRAVYGEGRYTDERGEIIYPKGRLNSALENENYDIHNVQTGELYTYHSSKEIDRIEPVSIYGFSKYAQEQLLQITCSTYGIDFCILRFQNVYGPGQSLLNSYTGVLNVFATRALLNKPINIFEDGKGLRDFIFIDDAVQAIYLAIASDKSMNRLYNVGSGIGTSIMQAAVAISKCLDKEIVCEITGTHRSGDIRHSIANISRLQQDLEFVPKHNFQQGLKKFIAWVKTQDISVEQSEETYRENINKGVLRIRK